MRSIIALVLVVTAAAAGAQTTQADPSYCSALTALSADLDQLQRFGPDAKATELRPLSDRITRDVRYAQKQAANKKTPASKIFLASSERLLVQTKAVTDDMTIVQINERIAPDVSNVRRSAGALASDAGCPLPDGAPTERP
jgi:hypothetical protein